MNAESHGADGAEPGDEAVEAAFSAFRADAANAFPAPPVDQLIMRGPAALRRRRMMSLAAVAGAAAAVTAGGFAVAQTLGPSSNEPDPITPANTAELGSTSEGSDGTELGQPATPESNEAEPSTGTAAEPDEPGAVLRLEAWDGAACDGGEFDFDRGEAAFGGETDWSVADGGGTDLDGDGDDELVLALTCDEETAVAAFGADGDALEPWGWVWEPSASQQLSEIADLSDGVITLQGLDGAAETWTARYEWDGEDFVAIDEGAPADPSPSESSQTPDPDETQTTQAPSTDSSEGS